MILNLFVALQEEPVSLATHWLADAGLDVPGSYRRDLPLLQRLEPLGPAYSAGASKVTRSLRKPLVRIAP